MKIMHLVHRSWPYHGGAERYVLEHALAGERWGHESVICTTDAWDMSWFVSRSGQNIKRKTDIWNGIEIIRFPVLHPPFQNIYRAILRRISECGPDRYYYPNPIIPSLHRWLTEGKGFDFVHANAMPLMLYEGWYYSKKHGTGLASVPHANAGEKYRRLKALHYFSGCQKNILRKSSFVVAQSRFEKGLYTDMGIPEERIHISGSGIDPAEFTASSRDRGLKRLGAGAPVILCLTAHSMDRGTANIIGACRALLKKGRDFTLVLAGPVLPDVDDFLDSEEKLAEEFGDRIVITGYVSREERIDLLSAADIVLLPSRLDCFGIVVLEAWISEKPIIGCWSGAMPDIIRDGENGFLVSWGDTVSLMNRIEILLENEEIRQDMGENGRKAVLERWTWDKVTDRFYMRLSQCCPEGSCV
ncbi:MAG: glycosyltransferase family 4 protein [Candidatus Aegiribacteria sp.]|nr:glycosyltransferase family 4 protein [Candidatus Aegiribacteria sp.]